jgi:hypothetical protein
VPSSERKRTKPESNEGKRLSMVLAEAFGANMTFTKAQRVAHTLMEIEPICRNCRHCRLPEDVVSRVHKIPLFCTREAGMATVYPGTFANNTHMKIYTTNIDDSCCWFAPRPGWRNSGT